MSATPVDPAAAGAASIPTDAPARATHRLLRLAIAAFALLIVLLIALHVHLYADGAFFLYQVIQTGATTEFAGGRGFAYLATQWPLVLGLRAGVTRVETLSHRILEEEHAAYVEALRILSSGRYRIDGRRVIVTAAS